MGKTLTAEQIEQYHRNGYLTVKGLFSPEQARQMAEHFMALRAQGEKPGDFGGVSEEDPNRQYPRFINMHAWDSKTTEWSSRPDLLRMAEQLIDDKPVLQQTMLYFKPPGGYGQGLHQDEQYITKDPLIGVWVALDKADRDNGQMVVVPGSHKLGLVAVEEADLSESFTPGQARLPEDAQEVGLDMEPGDTLFFDGKTIHGSYPNRTKDRFRRSFIIHFHGEHAQEFEAAQGTNMRHLAAKPPDPA